MAESFVYTSQTPVTITFGPTATNATPEQIAGSIYSYIKSIKFICDGPLFRVSRNPYPDDPNGK